jgi:uncharacterized protein YbcI
MRAIDSPQHAGGDLSSPLGVLSAVSGEMVRIYKAHFGRGPETVRTQWAGTDTLIVTLEHTLTPLELKLRALGEHERLRDLRVMMQHAKADTFCAPVERITGRTVRAFLSAIDVEADVSIETFILDRPATPG